ncbi:choline dehydrogenase [Sneathiella chinensis]|uniref:Choline dehydrogenase n=1 Tax=Sneathiella chinensis TaxID=349750 RepID=A0ABQ5U5E0_9PROT|nr:choline dehydrogenase [Sneathiella chinensis]GLQ06928.1 oxygen-dependent choline dehydrogenase [Sneathiella chinensis]
MPFDYVIVGAGSAGCVLANRLSEDPSVSVCLLDFGGSDNSLFIRMPTALSIPMNMDRFNWGFHSLPEPGLAGRRLDCPRGKVLGGSSSINGMVYVRGHACDFEEWQENGAAGWGYADVLPYFKRAEHWYKGGDTYRGGDGPVGVNNGNDMSLNPLYQSFIEAGRQAGYPVTDDYNGYQQEGFGPMHMTVDGGVRASTARAYLAPARSRKNLTVLTRCMANRLVFDGRRATGIHVTHQGSEKVISAVREVILSAGAIGSPTLLQRSGIGPAAILREKGIDPLFDLPGVGRNLQDHLEVYFQFRCTQPLSLNTRLNPVSKALIGARWLLFKSGLGATNHFESCAFIRSKAGQKWPDIQYHFLPAAMRYDGRTAFSGHGFQVHVGPNKPKSRGHVTIGSPAPDTAPEILFNYLTDPQDVEDWRRVIRLSREIILQPAFAPYRGDEIQPGAAVSSDQDIDDWVRDNVESAYHPSCTCKMGAENDPAAVVTPDCRVRGTEGLRIVDSSIFPTITNGNLNAPTIMVAEKAADQIRGRSPLPPSDADYWIDPDWQTRQRPGSPLS